MGSLWNLVPVQAKIGIWIAVVSAVLIAGTIVYNGIYSRGYDAATLVAEQEKAKQKRVNEEAISASSKVLRQQLDDLAFSNTQVENHVSELDAQADKEAAEDPAADADGLSADSVRRLNAVR